MRKEVVSHFLHNDLPGGNSALEPPDPIPNSEVKRRSADDSVGPPHVKVGHCQALIQNPDLPEVGVFLCVTNEPQSRGN